MAGAFLRAAAVGKTDSIAVDDDTRVQPAFEKVDDVLGGVQAHADGTFLR